MLRDILLDALLKTARKKNCASTVLSAAVSALDGQQTSPEQLHDWLVRGANPDRRAGRKLAQALVPSDRPAWGAYRPLTHLADGGMGSVWLAAAPDGDLVVVKTLRKDLGQSADLAQRFEREARITQDLDHPAAVRSIDAGQAADGTLYMVLEYVDAGDLQEVVEAADGLSEAQALSVLHQVTQAVARADEMHLVHRDIKPANIFAAADGSVKLADFGIARSTESDRTMLTMEGAIIGSPLFMSPEQVLGESNLDIRCDLYALGAVLYYCLAGEPPFIGTGKVQEIMHMHCEAPVPDLRATHPTIGRLTMQIIERCMAKRREQRYKTPKAMLKDLAKALKRCGGRIDQPVPLPVHLVENRRRLEADAQHPDVTSLTLAPDPTAETIGTDPAIDAAAETLATNLSDADGALPTIPEDTLLGPDDETPGKVATRPPDIDATIAQPDFGLGDTDATMAVHAMHNEFIDAAETGDWLILHPPAGKDPCAIVLYARPRLCLGKLCDAPVDIGVRYYPVPIHKPAVQRVSRQHCTLHYDHSLHTIVLQDLGSANGSMLDGRTLEAQQDVALTADHEHLLLLGGVVSLSLRVVPRRAEAPETIGGLGPARQAHLGLDTGLPLDGLLISRPDNRPEMHYAMVLRQLRIGGKDADLPVAHASNAVGGWIGRWHDHWIWRPDDGDWQPLRIGAQILAGGRPLLVSRGTHDFLATDW